MEYRELGSSGKKVSLLSFGGMRIPRVTVGKAVEVIKKACHLGINYFETAPGYGNSEHKIGVALRDLDRSKVYLSTKSHPGQDQKPEQLRNRLESSLKKLETDYVDFYQIWGLNTEEHYETVFKKGGTFEAVRKAQNEGLIKHIGFTSHGYPAFIQRLMETREFESLTMIYHLYHQRNKGLLDLADKLNMGVMIIAPLSNGFLAHPTPLMEEDFAPYPVRDYALQWLANDKRITSIVSGMKTFKELQNNYDSLNNFLYFDKTKTDIENKAFAKLRDRVGKDFCTECRECLPCPQGINIPELMRLNNLMRGYDAVYYCRDRYRFTGQGGSWYPGVKASHCDDCGDCEPRCPEKLPVVSIIRGLHQELYAGDRKSLATHQISEI